MYCRGVRSTNGNVDDVDGNCGAVIMAVTVSVMVLVVPVMVAIAVTVLV